MLRLRALNDDISPSAGDYGFDFCLFPLGHREFINRLLQIIKKSFPLFRRYHEMLVRLLHGARERAAAGRGAVAICALPDLCLRIVSDA